MDDVGPVFEARYPGRCACGEDFDEGDEVRYVDGELCLVGCCADDSPIDSLGFAP